jgi:hypothetical protein
MGKPWGNLWKLILCFQDVKGKPWKTIGMKDDERWGWNRMKPTDPKLAILR